MTSIFDGKSEGRRMLKIIEMTFMFILWAHFSNIYFPRACPAMGGGGGDTVITMQVKFEMIRPSSGMGMWKGSNHVFYVPLPLLASSPTFCVLYRHLMVVSICPFSFSTPPLSSLLVNASLGNSVISN